jgi:hypothetical protein
MHQRVNATCQYCGDSYLARAYEVRIGRTKYCSLTCHTLAIGDRISKALPRGINNPNWKGGIAKDKERQHIRCKTGYEVKTGVLVRKCCESCGETAFVEAHHYDYLASDHIVWLCKICHKVFTDIETREIRDGKTLETHRFCTFGAFPRGAPSKDPSSTDLGRWNAPRIPRTNGGLSSSSRAKGEEGE